MKIVAINASLRGSRGATAVLLRSLLHGAEQSGAITDTINLAEFELRHCLDCETCQKPGHFQKCVHDDDASAIYERMKSADLLVFATPVYTFAMSSLLKILLERYYFTADMKRFHITRSGLMFHGTNRELCGKPFALVVTCDNLMDATPSNIIQYFRTYARFMDAKMAGALVRKSTFLLGLAACQKQVEAPAVRDILEAWRGAGAELATRGGISARTLAAANRPLVRIPPFIRPFLSLPAVRARVEARHSEIMRAAICPESGFAVGSPIDRGRESMTADASPPRRNLRS